MLESVQQPFFRRVVTCFFICYDLSFITLFTLPLNPVLNHMDVVHILTSSLPMIHFNIINHLRLEFQ